MLKCNYDLAIELVSKENISTFEKKEKIAQLKKQRMNELKRIKHPDLDEYIFDCFQMVAHTHNFNMEDFLEYLDLKIINPYLKKTKINNYPVSITGHKWT